MSNVTSIPAPRVPFIDDRTGLMSREWYRFLLNLFMLTGAGTNDVTLADLQVAPQPQQPIETDDGKLSQLTAHYDVLTSIVEGAYLQVASAVSEPNKDALGLEPSRHDALMDSSMSKAKVLDYIDFNAQGTNPPQPDPGVLRFHSATTQGFTRFEQDNEAATNLVLGRDNVIIARNTSGGTINKGQPVYVTGSTGNVPNIAKAKADSSTTLPAIGVALDDIGDNNFGQVMKTGILANIDTSAYTAGDKLWVSAATAGAMVNTRPTGLVQRVGSVLVSGVGNGSMLVVTAPFVGGMETGTTSATFAVGSDSAALLAASQELTNKTLTSSVGKGTWTASGTWTLPALTFGGNVSSTGNPSLNIGSGALTAGATSVTTLATSGNVTVNTDKFTVAAGDGSIGLGAAAVLTMGANAYVKAGSSTGFTINNSADTLNLVKVSDAGAVRFFQMTGPTFAAGDKYLVIDANGNIHVSALGPAS